MTPGLLLTLCSGITSSGFSGLYGMRCRGSNLGRLRARPTHFPLCCCSGPSSLNSDVEGHTQCSGCVVVLDWNPDQPLHLRLHPQTILDCSPEVKATPPGLIGMNLLGHPSGDTAGLWASGSNSNLSLHHQHQGGLHFAELGEDPDKSCACHCQRWRAVLVPPRNFRSPLPAGSHKPGGRVRGSLEPNEPPAIGGK